MELRKNYPSDLSDEQWAVMDVPQELGDAVFAYREAQDATRGEWPSMRTVDEPAFPWPDTDNEMLRYLLWKYNGMLASDADPRTVILDLAVHAWFEGGIIGYDKGRQDAAAG
jgi:hypothetical protein